jgi:pantoate--beta-alanine ligase
MSRKILRCQTVRDVREQVGSHRKVGKRIGFLATMGALHAGHLSLAETLRDHVDVRVCSVFVNPTQFNDAKDYEAYLINIDADEAALDRVGVDILFAPPASEMYPVGFQTAVTLSELTKRWEGEHRPGHFSGVTTVVSMLFNIVAPDVTIFGEKDFQQLRLVEQMVSDLKMPITVIRGQLVRDPDGLAMSSRNARLSPEGRARALAISRGLFAAQALAKEGERVAAVLEGAVRKELVRAGIAEIDYVAVVDEGTLAPVEWIAASTRILVVARVDGVRLLDNVQL